MKFKVYIPARFASTRLPGKPLLQVAGRSLLQHVYERACESGAAEIVIATDDDRIAAHAGDIGAAVCHTSPEHDSGTARLAEAIDARDEADGTVIVNLQGDEPLMPAAVIRQVAALVGEAHEAAIATVCEPLGGPADLVDPNIVKVVRDRRGQALYFSRAPIPWDRASFAGGGALMSPNVDYYRRHVGIYAYTAAYLRRYSNLPRAMLAEIECLEQLRALVNGDRIAVPDAVAPCGFGIDTPQDLARLREQWPAAHAGSSSGQEMNA